MPGLSDITIKKYKPEYRDCTRGRANRMFKYFRNKTVYVKYIYENSLGHYYERSGVVKYDSFIILGDSSYFNVVLKRKGKVVWEQEFNAECGEFFGLGKVRFLNSGPYCYFIIKRINPIKRWLKCLGIKNILKKK